jgi:TatD DNase family protein
VHDAAETTSPSDPLFVDAKGRAVAAPDFGGAPIADTHAHLDMLEDPALALARAARAGVIFVATVADPSEDASRTYDLLPEWLASARAMLASAGGVGAAPEVPEVRIILGVHPHNAKNLVPQVEVELIRLASDARTAAIGEMGLDYHYDYSPREVQRSAFRRQLQLAVEMNLPAVVHLREAHADGEKIMREVGLPTAGCILHCYTMGPEPLEPFLALGCTVSFAGPASFKKAEEIRAAAIAVPVGRILTETDSPFMAPEPFRGRTNEPALVVFTAARLAAARGEDLPTFAEHAYSAALGILGGHEL